MCDRFNVVLGKLKLFEDHIEPSNLLLYSDYHRLSYATQSYTSNNDIYLFIYWLYMVVFIGYNYICTIS